MDWAGRTLLAVAGVIGVAIVLLAGAVAFGTAAPPPVMASVTDRMRQVDFSDEPPFEAFRARDRELLHDRAYHPQGTRVVVLIHGAAGTSSTTHVLASGLAAAGFAVYVPVLRGHGVDGRIGDIDYPGQLDDDLADLAQVIRRAHPQGGISMVGYSRGGGFALRIAEGRYGGLFCRYVLLAPNLRYDARTQPPLPGLGHTDLVTRPEAVPAVLAALQ